MGADVLGAVLLTAVFVPLLQAFATRQVFGWVWYVLVGTYILFCFAMNGVRKTTSQQTPPHPFLAKFAGVQTKPTTAVVGLLMAAALLFIQADINQLAESALELAQHPGEVHEGEVTLYFAFGPILIWVMIALFYLLVLVTQVEPKYPAHSTAAALLAGWSLFLNNSLLLLYTAYLVSSLNRLWGDGWTVSQTFLAALIMLAGWLLLFVPPRLFVYFKRPHLRPWLTFLLFTLYAFIAVLG